MRNKSVWERACGLTETVVENVEFDDAADAIVVSVRQLLERVAAVVNVGDGHLATTPVKVVVGGERWTWERLACSSKPGHLECSAATMA